MPLASCQMRLPSKPNWLCSSGTDQRRDTRRRSRPRSCSRNTVSGSMGRRSTASGARKCGFGADGDDAGVFAPAVRGGAGRGTCRRPGRRRPGGRSRSDRSLMRIRQVALVAVVRLQAANVEVGAARRRRLHLRADLVERCEAALPAVAVEHRVGRYTMAHAGTAPAPCGSSCPRARRRRPPEKSNRGPAWAARRRPRSGDGRPGEGYAAPRPRTRSEGWRRRRRASYLLAPGGVGARSMYSTTVLQVGLLRILRLSKPASGWSVASGRGCC